MITSSAKVPSAGNGSVIHLPRRKQLNQNGEKRRDLTSKLPVMVQKYAASPKGRETQEMSLEVRSERNQKRSNFYCLFSILLFRLDRTVNRFFFFIINLVGRDYVIYTFEVLKLQ